MRFSCTSLVLTVSEGHQNAYLVVVQESEFTGVSLMQ